MNLSGTATAGQRAWVGIGIDSTSTMTQQAAGIGSTASSMVAVCQHVAGPQFGYHFWQALEKMEAAATGTWFNDGAQFVAYWRC
jgi:hypothetical protein